MSVVSGYCFRCKRGALLEEYTSQKLGRVVLICNVCERFQSLVKQLKARIDA